MPQGPIGLNLSTFAGTKRAGFVGGLVEAFAFIKSFIVMFYIFHTCTISIMV